VRYGIVFTGKRAVPYVSAGRNTQAPGIITLIVVFIVSIIGALLWEAL
jgi:hypothetical protein